MSSLTVQNIQGSASSSNTINVASGHKITGAAGSLVAPGQVIQVYQHTSTATVSNTTTTYKSTGLFLTFTPFSSSSKFLVSFNGYGTNGTNTKKAVANVSINPSSSTNAGTVLAGGTLLATGTMGMAMNHSNSGQLVSALSASLLHAPATASAVTYNVVVKQEGGGIAYWAGYNILTTLTVMEIAQ